MTGVFSGLFRGSLGSSALSKGLSYCARSTNTGRFPPILGISCCERINTVTSFESTGITGKQSKESLRVKTGNTRPHEYKLPTLHCYEKRTILDPLLSKKEYQLPTIFDIVKEKVTPPTELITPKEDPNPLQKIMDQGVPPLVKESMPWMMTIRRKKMKKHKLKKFRKRMIFRNRRLAEKRKRRKEIALRKYEQDVIKEAEAFDIEKVAEEDIKLAKQGGWKVDVLKKVKLNQPSEKHP